jgi:tetratricopeptide (TPR) repeat protein
MKRIIIFLVIFSFSPLVLAQQSYQLRDVRTAIESKIDSWCSKYPLEHVALNTLGYCYLQENNFDQVGSILEEKLKEGFVDDIEKFTTYVLLGISKARLGDNEKAKEAFVQLKELAQKINGAEVYGVIDMLLRGCGNPPIDKNILNKSMEYLIKFVDKKEVEINSKDAVLAYAKGQYDGVIEQINNLAPSGNSVAQSVYEGKLALINGNFEAAIKSYDFSIVMDYAPADIYLDMAYAYNQLGKYAEAVAVINDFSRRDPLYGESCALRLLEEARKN